MYMTNDVRKVASVSQSEWSQALNSCTKPRVAPLSATALGPKSVFSTIGSPTFGSLVIADARVRDAKQAAPPRGLLC